MYIHVVTVLVTVIKGRDNCNVFHIIDKSTNIVYDNTREQTWMYHANVMQVEEISEMYLTLFYSVAMG